MKTTLIVVTGIFLAWTLGATAYAQDHTRNWENGYIVQISEIHIKDGMFNAYMNDLNAGWRKFQEAQMEDGDVIRFGMFAATNTRKGEPDLILTVTYKNWAAFDRGVEYFEELGKKVFGSTDNMRTENVNRGELRTLGSNYTLQEIKFKD